MEAVETLGKYDCHLEYSFYLKATLVVQSIYSREKLIDVIGL